ncbi:CaiB/BaiF CoA transferase family protein [Bradyrhizobium tunisiense]|uniref:CaiB/BaiF CoA transferase family protein n=1 Tax=Bradyrhizobium tunisiense TaxID=3278709 RepID=UPI0035E1747D
MSEGQNTLSDSVVGPAPALAGLRVLDIATFVAAPFCGTILADFGAEVIKIEQPQTGDALRKFGTETECGDTLVWLSEARNKKTMTLDLRTPEGADIFGQLVTKSDVVLENFRPGTLERWGLGFATLSAMNPQLIMLRISAYGQNGPKKDEPGFARIAHAFGGLTYLSGEPGRVPVVPGSTSIADYISGMWGAIGVLIALQALKTTGKGQFIDIGLYESVFRLLDEIAPAYAKFGKIRERMGADTVNVVPHSHYQTRTGEWVAVACTSDKMWERLAASMDRADLAIEYPTAPIRDANRETINPIVAEWIGSLSCEEVMAITANGGVPCGPVYSIADIFDDAQYAARENLIEVEDPRVGRLVLPAALPRLSETPARFRHAGRPLGADNVEILRTILGLSEADVEAMARRRVI